MEVEYIALSTSAREIIPLLSLAQEAATLGVITKVETPIIRCKIFEDNEGAVEMANMPKMRPRTKHLNIKYHFFRQFVEKGILQVSSLHTWRTTNRRRFHETSRGSILYLASREDNGLVI
jgi:hypothetical protein